MEDVLAINEGIDKTYVFLADSSQRDTSVYPSPTEYSVPFNAAFTNVVGFELLEVNVPRTDYIVDSTENTLTYALDVPTDIATWAGIGNVRTAVFTPGDYNLPQLIVHMNAVLSDVAAAHGDPAALVVEPVTTPPEVSNKIKIRANVPFCVLGDKSTARKTLGFGDPVSSVSSVSSGAYATVPGWSRSYPNGASGVFVAVPSTGGGAEVPIVVGPIPAGDGASVHLYGNIGTREYFIAPAAGSPLTVSAYLATLGSPPEGGWPVDVRVVRGVDDVTIATGRLMSNYNGYAPSVATLTATGMFVRGANYYLEMSSPGCVDGQCAAVVIATTNLPQISTSATAGPLSGFMTPLNDNELCVDIAAGADGYSVTSPGVVCLVGAMYLKIRCMELEQHLYRDRVGEPSAAGVGVVNLVGYGYMNQRYNFVHLPPIRFHPIGQLRKLTFRLERPDGSPYDSQGVDNNLLCAITYKVARPRDPTAFPAAPRYTPDFATMQRRAWQADDDAMTGAARSTRHRT